MSEDNHLDLGAQLLAAAGRARAPDLRCLVVGAGLLGSHVARELADCGYEVAVFTRGVNPWFTSERQEDIAVNFGEIEAERELLSELIEEADCVVHLASSSRPPMAAHAPALDLARTVVPALTVAEMVARHGDEKLLVTSSSGGTVYGTPLVLPTPETHPLRPTTPYAISHVALEHYLLHFQRHFRLRSATCRFGNVYGPGELGRGGQGVIGTWLREVALGEQPIALGDLDVARDFVYVDDAARAVRAIIENSCCGPYNIASSSATSLRELLGIVRDVIGIAIHPIAAPAGVRHATAEIRRTCLDITRIRQHVGWTPSVTLSEGIRLTWDWLRTEWLPELTENSYELLKRLERESG